MPPGRSAPRSTRWRRAVTATLPVSDGERGCIGVLTSYNVLHFLAELLPGSILNLPPRPHRNTRAPDGA